MRIPSHSSQSSGSVVIHDTSGKVPEVQDWRTLETRFFKEQQQGEEEDMVISPPLSPPRELQQGKYYALCDFEGPDPNHLPLTRNDAVELINDEDLYWWLVKLDTQEIGFVPLEILENYEERLARLNCWNNEQIEKLEKDQLVLDGHSVIEVNEDKIIDFNKVDTLQSNAKKSVVTFTIEEPDTVPENKTDVYEFVGLNVTKKSFLYDENFLINSLDDYQKPSGINFTKEDSIGSFSSDTVSPEFENTLKWKESTTTDSIKLLDKFIKDEIDPKSSTESLTSLEYTNTTTPLTSGSYLPDVEEKLHPFVTTLFQDLIEELDSLHQLILSL